MMPAGVPEELRVFPSCELLPDFEVNGVVANGNEALKGDNGVNDRGISTASCICGET
jgi:hypothetical protein